MEYWNFHIFMSIQNEPIQEGWVNILTKGLITIPKKMRDSLGLKEGDIAHMKVEQNRIIIEPRSKKGFEEFRQYTKKQIKEFIREDELDEPEKKIAEEFWKNLP